MARAIHRLTGADLRRKAAGYYADGGGLWLQVTVGKQVNRSWLYRYTISTRTREMGLGSLLNVGLSEAREAAQECRKQRLASIDPIEHRRARRAEQVAAAAKIVTFDRCLDQYLAAHRAGWQNEKHARQWETTVRRYASSVFGDLSVANVDTAMILRTLTPLWARAPETASRLRGRLEQVLDFARVHGYREGDNPARWRGHLSKLLPTHRRLRPRKHLAAMPFQAVPAFMRELRNHDGTAARALEFLILTSTRSAETRFARWSEVDLDNKIWVVPAERMKMRKEHRVPLSSGAVEILRAVSKQDPAGYIFPGSSRDSPVWENAFAYVLKQLGHAGTTVHGFRSSFRDWAGDATAFSREVAEQALAHVAGNAVEIAYRRGDALAKRRRLMQAWSDYCARPTRAQVDSTVVTLTRRGR
jgi:integrase